MMTEEETREYQKAYWRKNRLKINKERRKRYREDEEHRAMAQQKAAARYESVKGESTETSQKRGKNKPRLVMVGEKKVKVFSSGYLLSKLPVSSITLASWEKGSVVPCPTVTDSIGRRWYSEAHIDFLVRAISELRGDSWFLEDFRQAVMKKWKRLVGSAPIITEKFNDTRRDTNGGD